MTREEAIERLKLMKQEWDKHIYDLGNAVALKMAIKALEPCDDCVSRQAVEKITWEEPSYTDALNVLTEVREKVRVLPPIQSKAKVGKWIRWYEEITRDSGVIEHIPHCKCSECNKEYDSYSSRFMNYCPNCGAEMQEVEK